MPAVWPNGFPNPPKNGGDPDHHNRNEVNWTTKGGHYGHCHVPVNVHWDPAYTADEVAYVMGVPATDDVQLVAEKETLEMGGRAARRAVGKKKAARPGSRKPRATKTRATKARKKRKS